MIMKDTACLSISYFDWKYKTRAMGFKSDLELR